MGKFGEKNEQLFPWSQLLFLHLHLQYVTHLVIFSAPVGDVLTFFLEKKHPIICFEQFWKNYKVENMVVGELSFTARINTCLSDPMDRCKWNYF